MSRIFINCLIAGALVACVPLYSPVYAAEVQYRLDASQTRVVSLSNLADDGMCLPDQLNGKVAQRSFDKSGLVVQSFVLEYGDGSREFINVDTPRFERLNMAARGWVLQGLQTMLKEGRTVSLKAQRCGAAGRVLVLDGIILSTP